MGHFRAAFFGAEKTGVWLLVLFGLFISAEATSGDEGEYSQAFYVDMAYRFLEAGGSDLVLRAPRDDLDVARVWKDRQDNTHVRFRQVIDSVPVWSGEVLVHMRADGGVYNVSGNIVEIVEGNMPEVRISTENCIDVVRELSGGRYKQARIGATELLVDLVDGLPRKVYRVETSLGLKREFLFIDANNGELIQALTGSPTK